ncbi:MAG: TolC family protein [Chitinophagales bacterium]
MRKYKVAMALLLLAANCLGQTAAVLTVEQAVQKALAKNYDIQLIRNVADEARINNTPGNAGMLPNVNLQASDNFSYNSLHQKLSNGSDVRVNGVQGNALSAGVVLNWTVFDGARMFMEKKRLSKLQEVGELQWKSQIQQTITQVVALYYSIVSYKQQSAALQESIQYNTERANLARNKFEIGVSAKTDWLQSQIDLNARKSDLLQLELNIANAKHQLNEWMGEAPVVAFEVVDSIRLSPPTTIQQAVSRAQEQNVQLQLLRRQSDIARINQQELQAQRWPKIALNGGYYFTRNNNSAGFQLLNETYGPQVGFSASMPLFNGLNINRQVKAARFEQQYADLKVNQFNLTINRQLSDAYQSYAVLMEQKKLAAESVQFSKENLVIATERFRLGGTNTLEVRQAQLSFEDAANRYAQVLYQLKLNETAIKLLLNAW